MAALRRPADRGRRQKCKRRLTKGHIDRLFLRRPLLISKRRLTKKGQEWPGQEGNILGCYQSEPFGEFENISNRCYPPQIKAIPVDSRPVVSFTVETWGGITIGQFYDGKNGAKRTIDQLGHSLSRIIHAFAETDDDAVIFMAKWDIKDGFWRLDAKKGAEYNFSYVMPQPLGSPHCWWYPLCSKWGGSNHPHFSVQRQRRRATLQAPIAKRE